MTVKSVRGRRRYCAFKTSPSLDRNTLSANLPKDGRFRTIQCAKGMAVVRCGPEDVEECRRAVSSADGAARMVRISGTLRTLRERYSVLRENAPARPPHKGTPPAAVREARKEGLGGSGPVNKQ